MLISQISYIKLVRLHQLSYIQQRRKEYLGRFAKNGIKNNTLKDLFPLNNKKHNMNTRKNEKYVVNFANTNRLKNASVISMQKILNDEH